MCVIYAENQILNNQIASAKIYEIKVKHGIYLIL